MVRHGVFLACVFWELRKKGVALAMKVVLEPAPHLVRNHAYEYHPPAMGCQFIAPKKR